MADSSSDDMATSREKAPVSSANAESNDAIARLYGESVLEMPNDLYIPPEALEVFLDAFEGPLDFLLYPYPETEFQHPRHSNGTADAAIPAIRRPYPIAIKLETGCRIPADGSFTR